MTANAGVADTKGRCEIGHCQPEDPTVFVLLSPLRLPFLWPLQPMLCKLDVINRGNYSIILLRLLFVVAEATRFGLDST